MDKSALYAAIFRRKSVRKYKMTPLSSEKIANLKQYLGKIQPLDCSILTLFAVVNQNEVTDPFRIKAPHYLCLFSETKGPYLMNAGFLMQQVDLYLSALGLGSCWLGLARPNKEVPTIEDGLHYVIMLAFGEADGPVHRVSIDEFRRHELPEITDIPTENPHMADILEPVRLAPSASNTQPWHFTGSTSDLTVWRKRPNLIQAALYSRMNQIDIGIALCHLWLAADNFGKRTVFTLDAAEKRSGFSWMANVQIDA